MNKDIKRKLKKFTRFLKENNCYNEYFNNYDICDVHNRFLRLIINNYRQLFLFSFNWRKTKEGYKFWSNLDNKWFKYINE